MAKRLSVLPIIALAWWWIGGDASSMSSSRTSTTSADMFSSINKQLEGEELEWLRERNAWHRALVGSGGLAKLDSNETRALEEFYVALGGDSSRPGGWNWNPDYAKYGVPWNFTKTRDGSSYLQDPCHFQWQGIHCNCNVTPVAPDVQHYYYDVESMQHDNEYPCRIDKIYLLAHGLKGPFPQQAAAKLLHLTHLQLHNNDLSGPLSNFCGLSANLTHFAVSDNHIGSTIPSCLGNYTKLRFFNFYNNTITGDLSLLCLLSNKLTVFVLDYNSLVGSIPSCIGRFTSLNILALASNRLVGHLTPICSLTTTLNTLDLQVNSFSGSLPSCIGGYSALTFLKLASNAFSSSRIPTFLGKLTNLQQLFLSNNAFSSTLPSFLANFKSLRVLSLFSNSLDGSLDVLCDLPKDTMTTIALEGNKFTSTLPSCLYYFTALQFLQLGNNRLRGNMPSPPSLQNLSWNALQVITLDHNHLTGDIPVQLKSLASLTQILLNDNSFDSSLPVFVDPLVQSKLIFVDVSNNPFTGHLSPTFFLLPGLEYFSAAVMCLDNGGTLPEAICEATNLKYLVLSGLTSHPSCRKMLFPKLGFVQNTHLGININGSRPNNQMGGSIPSCIFQLPSLSSFHATGGGFIGQLPPFTSAPLQYLAVSHNLLTGTVPPSIWQLKDLKYLDLAKNKFSGTCEALQDNPSIRNNVTIRFDVNRLSGTTPSNLIQVEEGKIDILQGNLFTCNFRLGLLAMFYPDDKFPQNDPDLSHYNCGSCRLNAAMYMAAAVFGFIFLVISAYVYGGTREISELVEGSWRHQIAESMQLVGDWHAITRRDLDVGLGDRMPYVFRFLDVLAKLRRNVVYVLAFHVLVLLPIYIALSSDTSISTILYVSGWATSASFLHGQTATIVLFVFWFGLLIGMSRMSIFHLLSGGKDPRLAEQYKKRAEVKTQRVQLTLFARQAFLLFVSCIVMVFANVYYTSVSIPAFIIGLSALKLFWNWVVAPWSIQTPIFRFGLTKLQIGDETFFTIVLYALNNFLIPIFAVMITSSNCFFHKFTSSPNLNSTVVFPAQFIAKFEGNHFLTIPALVQNTSYTPPAFYTYQCTSDVLVNYTPVFIIMYVFMSISYVVMDVFVRYVCFPVCTIEEEEARLEQQHKMQLHSGDDSKGKRVDEEASDHDDEKKGSWHAWIRIFFLKRMVSKMLLTPHERIELSQLSDVSPHSFSFSSSIISAPAFDTTIDTNDEGKLVSRQFRPKLFLINQVTNLLLLFTFGATSPLLSLVIVTAMITHTIHLTLVIGRFVNNEAKSEMRGKRKNLVGGIDKSNRIGGIDQLNEECRDFKFHFMYKTRWLLLLLSSSFYAFFLMDICGDKMDYTVALVPFLLMLLTPILIFTLEYVLSACFGYQVSPEPLPLVLSKKRGVTEHGFELEPTATLNPLSSMTTDTERADQEEELEEDLVDEIPSNSSTNQATISIFHKDVKFIRPLPLNARHDNVSAVNAATLHALDAAARTISM